MLSPLTALSPIDGRYHTKAKALSPYFSEYALIYYRLKVEVEWLCTLAAEEQVTACPAITPKALEDLQTLLRQFNPEEAESVKSIEATTNHDVKAVEYYLRSFCEKHKELKQHTSFIHFALTSEDVNNLAYALMIKDALNDVIEPNLEQINVQLQTFAHNYHARPMLSHTHGQPASPTTLGKEFANVLARIRNQVDQMQQLPIYGKCNGAVGNYNAHIVAYPELDWPSLSKKFITSLKLDFNPYTTQIEPHDWVAAYAHSMSRINSILIDFARDIWTYISLGYFTQKKKEGEVGSSTMPHKVNPIDFENAEGNLGLANALFQFFANKLPISRMQRDLSDSTTFRNIGSAYAYTLIAYEALLKGIAKLQVNETKLDNDLDMHWVLLAEPIQTVMRAHGIEDAYEQLKALTRGETLDKTTLHGFIDSLALPDNEKVKLKDLSPASYIGLASQLAQSV